MNRALRCVPVVCVVALVALGGTAYGQSDAGSESRHAAGKQLYDKYCAQCHGETGRGDGIAAPRTLPKPRDFTRGKYKIRTTPSGRLPTDADIERAIRLGLPYTSMPGWPQFSDAQVRQMVAYIKSFNPDFENPDKHGEPIAIPDPPDYNDESALRGREVYEQMGCIQCHGQDGRGDGASAPTMVDEQGEPIRPADLTMRWTYRGGPSRRDIFRTFTTGLDGTPMPAYADTIPIEDRWALVDYIVSIGEGDDPDYDNIVVVRFVERGIDLDEADELFEGAPVARIPLVGQIMQVGRNFYPPQSSVEVQAVHNRREFALRVRWHDRRADTSGHNDPTLEVPAFEARQDATSTDEDDIWGGAAEEPAEVDVWGDAVADDAGGDFWGDEGGDGAAGGSEWSDSVAVQFPKVKPTGIVRPYFLFGDAANAVDLWFVDLARDAVQQFTGNGSDALERTIGDDIDVVTAYDAGAWTVTFRRSMKATGGMTLEPGAYVPIAFSVWNGLNDERGNRRALSQWQHLYVEPPQKVSALWPMIRIALLVLLAEIVVIWFVRRRYGPGARAQRSDAAETLLPTVNV